MTTSAQAKTFHVVAHRQADGSQLEARWRSIFSDLFAGTEPDIIPSGLIRWDPRDYFWVIDSLALLRRLYLDLRYMRLLICRALREGHLRAYHKYKDREGDIEEAIDTLRNQILTFYESYRERNITS